MFDDELDMGDVTRIIRQYVHVPPESYSYIVFIMYCYSLESYSQPGLP